MQRYQKFMKELSIQKEKCFMKYELKFVIGKILHMAFAFLHVECLAFLPKYFHTGFAGNEKKV